MKKLAKFLGYETEGLSYTLFQKDAAAIAAMICLFIIGIYVGKLI